MELVGLSSLIVAMGVTWMATPWVIRLAKLLGAMDHPGERKAHATPMPRIGGLAVFLGFMAGLAFAAFATGALLTVSQNAVYWRGLAFATCGIMLVGLADDLWGLRFYWKFAAQFVAATYVWSCGFSIDLVTNPLGGGLELDWLSLPVTVLWIVGITNAVNLIDGLDGLAAGIALITTASVAAIAMVSGALGITAASIALAGALIGFLRWNFNPAQIFLGDSGSLFLGFVLAVTSVRGSQKTPTAVAVLVPLLVLGLPLLDTSMAVVRRLWRISSHGRRAPSRVRYVVRNLNQVFLPDRGHIHHRLVDLGLSHRAAVLTLYLVGGAFAVMAFILVVSKNIWVALLLFAVLALMMATFVILLYFRSGPRQEPIPTEESTPPAVSRAPTEEGPREPLVASGNTLRR